MMIGSQFWYHVRDALWGSSGSQHQHQRTDEIAGQSRRLTALQALHEETNTPVRGRTVPSTPALLSIFSAQGFLLNSLILSMQSQHTDCIYRMFSSHQNHSQLQFHGRRVPVFLPKKHSLPNQDTAKPRRSGS